ncbi:Paraquat-inducible protein A [Thiocapsa marina 5811]|uniref:Paraquat-inducible protein A n=2 Tax=Thiocapsa marina TaxID=244573 RepID=F9UB75_9GAMM|nr:Paraquat-inducible protein A [Thiocapsa marina 5811]
MADVVACPGCDLLQHLPPIPPKGRARCPRCGEIVATTPADPIERPLALALAAAITLVVANAMPLMTLSVVGRFAETTILGGAEVMWRQGQPITATLVAFCTAVAPTIYLVLMCTLLVAARRAPAPAWVGPLLRLAEHAKAWSLPEVMLLGILVALVKIADLATVEPGIGLFSTGALLVLLATLAVQFDPEAVWHRIAWVNPAALHHRGKGIAAVPDGDPNA